MAFRSRIVPAVCVLLALSLVTYRQLGYWSSNYDLWTHALAVTDRNFIAQDNLGGALLLLGKPDEAYAHFQAAAEINPDDPMSRSNLGAYLQEHGHLNGAIEQYKRVISMTSDAGLLAGAYANLGTAYRRLGTMKGSRELRSVAAVELQPTQCLSGAWQLLEKQNKLDEAISDYSRSVELRPTDRGFVFLGHALENAGRRPEALAVYQQALKLSPDSDRSAACGGCAVLEAALTPPHVCFAADYFFSAMSTLARVVSQSRCMAQVDPVWSKPIVKFSTGEGNGETFMSTRTKSSPRPG